MHAPYLEVSRNLFTLFADDVRQEIGNKLTIVGVYQAQMLVPKFPLVLPKLAIVMSATTPHSEPFEEIIFEVLRDSTVIQEVNFDPEEIQVPVAADTEGREELLQVQCIAVLGPLQFDGPCTLQTRLKTEEGYLRGATLQILQTPTRQTTH
jgi:glutaredoxin 2